MPPANPNYLPPASVVALRGLGPFLEERFASGGARQVVGNFIEAAALATADDQGIDAYREAFQEVEDTIGPTRVNSIMRQARGRTAVALAETASELTGRTWQAALSISGGFGISAASLGSYPGLIAQALPYAQAAYAVYNWIGAVRRELGGDVDFEALAYQRLRTFALSDAVNLALTNRLDVAEDWSPGSPFQNIREGVLDYLGEYYQPAFEQKVAEYLACEAAWEDEWHGGFWPGGSDCWARLRDSVDEDAFADSAARVISALLGDEAMARPDLREPTGGMIGARREAHHAQMERERQAAAARTQPNITNNRIRDAIVEAMTLRTHSGHMTIQPGDLRNALAPGNVNGRVVPPQRVRAGRGQDYERMVTTVFGIGVEPDWDNIPVEPGDVINAAVKTLLRGPNLVLHIKTRSRYGAGWNWAGSGFIITPRVPRHRAAYPASHYDWASYARGPRPGGGVAGAEFANEAVPEAARRQAEEYAPGLVDEAAVEAQLGGYQGRRFAPSVAPRRRQTGFQGGFQPRVQAQASGPGRDRGPGEGTGEESAQQEENAQGTVIAAGMGAGALLGIGLAIALTR